MDIGRYTLVGQLPGGRYGAIWKARDLRVGQEVVLKQLALAAPDRRQQIVTQAAAVSRLRHKHIARTFDPIEDDSSIWLVEEWIDGATLATLMNTNVRLSLPQMLGVLHGAVQGLAFAHQHGLVHGDLSPRTIMVSTEGVAKLVGFGAWLGLPEAAGVGGYASPEAFAGASLATTADVYSAGALFARMLPDHATPGGHLSPGEPISLDGVQADLSRVLGRALSANPQLRQPNAQVLLDELDHAAQRELGVAWWTGEGLGAAVASSAGATFASGSAAASGGLGSIAGSSTAASPAGGFGAVAGSMNLQGELGALTGAKGPAAGWAAVAGSTRVARRGSLKAIAIGAGAVGLVVVIAVAMFLSVKPHSIQADPKPATRAEATTGGQPQQQPTQSPTPRPTPSAPPPKANPAEGFSGIYRYQSVVTKSTSAAQPIGGKVTATWVVKTTCDKGRCKTSIKSSGSGNEPLTVDVGSWNTKVAGKGRCVNLRTRRATGQLVPTLWTRTIKPRKYNQELVTAMSGTDRFRQTKPCKHQSVPLFSVTKKITLTFLRT